MPTPHISAQIGDIAPRIIMPGDPLRAKHIAQHYLEDVVLMNDIRNMLGYTGTYQGIKVSVMGSGMGIPSLAIYMSELIHHYGVHTFIRAGSAGTISNKVDIQSLVLCQAAASNSAFVDQ